MFLKFLASPPSVHILNWKVVTQFTLFLKFRTHSDSDFRLCKPEINPKNSALEDSTPHEDTLPIAEDSNLFCGSKEIFFFFF